MGILGVITFITFLGILAGIQARAYMLARNPDYNQNARATANIISWVLVAIIGINGLWVVDTYVYDIPNPFGGPMMDETKKPAPVPSKAYKPSPEPVKGVERPDAIKEKAAAHRERLKRL